MQDGEGSMWRLPTPSISGDEPNILAGRKADWREPRESQAARNSARGDSSEFSSTAGLPPGGFTGDVGTFTADDTGAPVTGQTRA